MPSVKEAIKTILPGSVLATLKNSPPVKNLRMWMQDRSYKDAHPQEVFSHIYESGVWGDSADPSRPYFSGYGSNRDELVSVYVNAVQECLNTFPNKPDAVDIGCGDFYVGQKIRSLCNSYTACDIVPKLIEFNSEKFKALNVGFRVLDVSQDELPHGDIVFIRQVLQHLSNEKISRALIKISATYKYLVLTEHLPKQPHFKHNLDKPTGPNNRIYKKSGVVLTSPPFNLRPKSERELCRVIDAGGQIVTTLYEL